MERLAYGDLFELISDVYPVRRGITEVTLDLEKPHYWLVVREN